MANSPESIKIECVKCSKTYFTTESKRSKAVCPLCSEPALPPHAGIVRPRKLSQSGIRKRKKSSEKVKSTSTFLGAPSGFRAELDEITEDLPKIIKEQTSTGSAFKEALAMSRMELELGSDAFYDPPQSVETNFDEPTVAISIKAELDDQTKPPFQISKATRPKIPVPKTEAAFIKPGNPFEHDAIRTAPLGELLKKVRAQKGGLKAGLGSIKLQKIATKPVIKIPKILRRSKEYEEDLFVQLKALDKKRAENPDSGLASERRGSGFIRLPTTDILDVLGQGNYRLRVEDIVYEPVDEKGLTTLIKGGVLLGAEEIADTNGDWMPISTHPVFAKLRQRMAEEAHSLLSSVTKGKPSKSFKISSTPKNDLGAKTEEIKTEEIKKQDKEPTTPPLLKSARQPPSKTMQMFAQVRETAPIATLRAEEAPEIPLPEASSETLEAVSESSIADSGFSDEHEVPDIPPIPSEASSPFVAFEPSLVNDELVDDEDETRVHIKKKKKGSKFGMFMGIGTLLLIAIASIVYAQSEGLFSPLVELGTSELAVAEEIKIKKEEKKVKKKIVLAEKAEKEQPEKPKEKLTEIEKDSVEKDSVVGEKDSVEKDSVGEKDSVVGEKDSVVGEKVDIVAEKVDIVVNPSIDNLKDAVFIKNASGKRPALMFKKNAQHFLLIPGMQQVEDLKRIVSGQKLCQLLDCPFLQAPLTRVALPFHELGGWGKYPAKMIVRDGRISALMQPIQKEKVFEIASTSKWRPVLSASSKKREKRANELIDNPDLTMSSQSFARQLGGIILRDFLVNDWNRFEREPSHIAISGDKLLVQASTVAFAARASSRVKGRFSWTSVFPEEMVEKLKTLNREKTFDSLFPNPSAADKTRFGIFWKQRQIALDRIEELTKKHGKQKVLLKKN